MSSFCSAWADTPWVVVISGSGTEEDPMSLAATGLAKSIAEKTIKE
ncbi:MAG: hypothetical protein F6J93_40635 [Oscillatoria sp. SIO1A7]|nr:hypothetical protein [Oscillatoria sp. SIO1A7]